MRPPHQCQNASAASSIIVSLPASMRVLRSAVSGIRRSMKKRAVTSLAFRNSSSEEPEAQRSLGRLRHTGVHVTEDHQTEEMHIVCGAGTGIVRLCHGRSA